MSSSCDPMDCGMPGFSVYGISQVRGLEWVATSFSRGSSRPRDRTWVSCTASRSFTNWPHQGSPIAMRPSSKSLAAAGHLLSTKEEFPRRPDVCFCGATSHRPAGPRALRKAALAGQALPLHLPQELLCDSAGSDPWDEGRAFLPGPRISR